MTAVRIVLATLALALGYSWVGPSLAQTLPGTGGIPGNVMPGQPGLRLPNIPA